MIRGFALLPLMFMITGCVGYVYDSNAFHGEPISVNVPRGVWIDEISMPAADRWGSLGNDPYKAEALLVSRREFPGIFQDDLDAVQIRARLVNSETEGVFFVTQLFSVLVSLGTVFVIPIYNGGSTNDTWQLDFVCPETGEVIHQTVLNCSGEWARFESIIPTAWLLVASSSPRTELTHTNDNANLYIADVRPRMEALVWGIAREVAYHHDGVSNGAGE